MAQSNLGSNSQDPDQNPLNRLIPVNIFVLDGTPALCHPDENNARGSRSLEVIATGEGLRLNFFYIQF